MQFQGFITSAAPMHKMIFAGPEGSTVSVESVCRGRTVALRRRFLLSSSFCLRDGLLGSPL